MKKLLALLLVLTLLASFPLTAAADEVDIMVNSGNSPQNVAKDQTAVVEEGGTVTSNNGTVTKNEGTVTYNNQGGKIGVSGDTDSGNYGKVEVNNGGTIYTNHGNKAHGDDGNRRAAEDISGGIVQNNVNNGYIHTNNGVVNENGSNAKIETNNGLVRENENMVVHNSGIVLENNDKVLTNETNGYVDKNSGTIGTELDTTSTSGNKGEVNKNDGTIVKNHAGAEVQDNHGHVDENAGTVQNNTLKTFPYDGTTLVVAGKVRKNSGAVVNNTGIVENVAGGTIGGAGTLQAVEKDGTVTVVETEKGVTDVGTFYGIQGLESGEENASSVLVQVKEGMTASLNTLFGFRKEGYTLTGYEDAAGNSYGADQEVTFQITTNNNGSSTINGFSFRFFAQWLKNAVQETASGSTVAASGSGTPASAAPAAKIYQVVGTADGKTTIEAEAAQLKGVYVDGKFVEPENYTISTDAQGRLEITFTAEYLATLAQGEHTVWLNLTDGGAVFKLIIE